MRKNLNKLIAFGIGISVISSSIMPALGAEINRNTASAQIGTTVNKNSKVLTVSDAVQAGIENDEQIKVYEAQMNYYKKYGNYLDEDDASDYDQDSNDLSYDTAKQNKEFQKDKVEYTISSLFSTIITAQEEIDVLEQSINVQERKLEETKLKNKQGLSTSIDVTSAENDLSSQKTSLINKKAKLNDNKVKFSLLTGINTNDYTLDNAMQYKTFKIDGNVDDYIDDKIDEYLKYKDQLVDLMKDQVDELKDDDYDQMPDKPSKSDFQDKLDSEGNVVSSKDDQYNAAKSKYDLAVKAYTGYLSLKMNSQTTDLQLQQSRKTLKSTIRSVYTSLGDIENQIADAKSQVELANKKLANTKLQYQLGLMTTSDYNQAVASAKSADVQMRTLVENYNNMIITIEKPWAML